MRLAAMGIAGDAKLIGHGRGAIQQASLLLHHADQASTPKSFWVHLEAVVEPLVEPPLRALDLPMITGLLFCCAWLEGGVSRPCYKIAHLQAPGLTVFSS